MTTCLSRRSLIAAAAALAVRRASASTPDPEGRWVPYLPPFAQSGIFSFFVGSTAHSVTKEYAKTGAIIHPERLTKENLLAFIGKKEAELNTSMASSQKVGGGSKEMQHYIGLDRQGLAYCSQLRALLSRPDGLDVVKKLHELHNNIYLQGEAAQEAFRNIAISFNSADTLVFEPSSGSTDISNFYLRVDATRNSAFRDPTLMHGLLAKYGLTDRDGPDRSADVILSPDNKTFVLLNFDNTPIMAAGAEGFKKQLTALVREIGVKSGFDPRVMDFNSKAICASLVPDGHGGYTGSFDSSAFGQAARSAILALPSCGDGKPRGWDGIIFNPGMNTFRIPDLARTGDLNAVAEAIFNLGMAGFTKEKTVLPDSLRCGPKPG